MKIYNKVVMDIKTLEIIEEDSFEYEGPLVLCYTSGSESNSENIDYGYNMIMGGIAQSQQAQADEYLEYWKSGAGEWEYTDAPKGTWKFLAGGLTSGGDAATRYGMMQAWMKNKGYSYSPEGRLSTKKWVPEEGAVSYRDVESAQNIANLGLMPRQTRLQETLLDEQQKALEASAPIRSEYFKQSLAGVNPQGAMNRAQSDVERGYGLASQSLKGQAFRAGADPGSGGYLNRQGALNLAKIKGIAGARTGARTRVEDINYDRLRTASGLSGGELS